MHSIKTGFRVALVIGAVLVGSALVTYTITQSMFVVDSSRSSRLNRIADEGMELVHLTHAVLQYPGPRSIGQWQTQFAELSQLFEKNDNVPDPDVGDVIARAKDRLRILVNLKEKLSDARDKAAVGKLTPEIAEILSAQLFQEATQLQAAMKAVRSASNASLQQTFEQARIRQIEIFLLFAMLATLFGIVLSIGFRKRILNPLNNLEMTIDALREGHSQRATIIRNDEIGNICITFNNLLDEHDLAKLASERSAHEIMKLNNELLLQTQTLTRTNADLQRFAEVAAHHLQEPARRMATYAERLTQQLGGRFEDEQTRLSLEYIGQQARHQQNLLRDVERYLASDQPRGEVKSIDARLKVAGILARAKHRISTVDAEITLGDLPPASIDAPRLDDVFTVVLDNALCHGCSERPLKIAISGERQGNKVRYSVSDNGPGVEESYRERVFRVFERLTSGGAVVGTGIGLAILRRVAESCGGRAWIEEAPGGGCCVLFELPIGEIGGPQ